MRRQGRTQILGGVAAVVITVILAYLIRWRMHPSACPYRGWGFTLDLPRPHWIGRGRLPGLLAPRAGRGILEVGPGTGCFASFWA
jgi:hypothetical protein